MTPKRLSQPPFPKPGERIVVVGTTGSGKTSLAAELARLQGIPHVEIDALHWEPGWKEPPLEVFRQRVAQALAGDAWVADGNYAKVRDLTWGRASTLVWLDYELVVILPRMIKRTLHRIMTREVLWNSNRETLRDAFFSKDSLFLYLFTSQRRQRNSYPQLLLQPDYATVQVIHARSPREIDQWVNRLGS
jgi:adenylate kinase family enzyme